MQKLSHPFRTLWKKKTFFKFNFKQIVDMKNCESTEIPNFEMLLG